MKFVVLVSTMLGASARLQVADQGKLTHQVALASDSRRRGGGDGGGAVHYGDSRCPCIGFDNIEGETMVQIGMEDKEKMPVSYPADLGARCEAWDDKRHPKCKQGAEPGSGEDWCGQAWCYVDPCRCDIDVLPKISNYLGEATYMGKPPFWSYATCGGKDMFTKQIPEVGRPKCRCIGFADVAGTTEITIDGKMVEYPADIGTGCQAWDLNTNPECKGDKPPSWCKANWCYVDPCECELPGDIVPKISAYLPKATFTGKNLYYSYETCGSPDTWTEKNHHGACVNQDTEEACGKLVRCSWTGSKCLGSELVNHPLCQAEEVKARSGSAPVSSGFFTIGAALMAMAAACP